MMMKILRPKQRSYSRRPRNPSLVSDTWHVASALAFFRPPGAKHCRRLTTSGWKQAPTPLPIVNIHFYVFYRCTERSNIPLGCLSAFMQSAASTYHQRRVYKPRLQPPSQWSIPECTQAMVWSRFECCYRESSLLSCRSDS